MNIRSASMLILSLLLIFGLQGRSTAEDWSIRKFNPFGPRPASKNQVVQKEEKQTPKTSREMSNAKKVESEREDANQTATRATAPSTTVEIQRRFAMFGRETAAAFQRTRQALTPEFEWPKWEPLRIKFPSLMSSAEPEKVME